MAAAALQPATDLDEQPGSQGRGVVAGFTASMRSRRLAPFNFRGQTVFLTGGSWGLGFFLAHEVIARGATAAISARIPTEGIQRTPRGSPSVKDFGALDVLVTSAGVIGVGLAESMTVDDRRHAINTTLGDRISRPLPLGRRCRTAARAAS